MAHDFTPANPFTLPVGAWVFFRCNGTGTAYAATVEPRGPHGQFFLRIEGLGRLAVNAHRELFEI